MVKNGVRNRIASFEAQNDEIRALSPRSPTAHSTASSSVSVKSYEESSPSRPTSTSFASQSRINRLQRQAVEDTLASSNGENRIRSRGALDGSHNQRLARRVGDGNHQRSVNREQPMHHSNQAHEFSNRNGRSRTTPQSQFRPHPEPNNNDSQSNMKTTALSTRMTKIQRIHKMKSMAEYSRRNTAANRPTTDPALMDANTEPQAGTATVNYHSPTKINQTSLPDEPNDDDITLTSVRQIVGTAHSEDDRDIPDQSMGPAQKFGDFRGQDARLWADGEEKSDKAHKRGGLAVTRSSSSDYDQHNHMRTFRGPSNVPHDPSTLSGMSAGNSQLTPDVAMFFHQRQIRRKNVGPPGGDDDENTYDYGDRDDNDSQGSLSYEQRRLKGVREKEARDAAVAAAKAEMEGPFVKKEDIEHYRSSLDTPVVKTVAGVAGAAALGCIAVGPVGLLLGAAAVGIGVGVMQIPEEQRSNLCNKATDAMKGAHESALNASESISDSCANTYRESGIADHIPVEMQSCGAPTNESRTKVDNESGKGNDAGCETSMQESGKRVDAAGENTKNKNTAPPPASSKRVGNKHQDKVSCLQEGQFVQVSEIHSLDPASQPRAWLDVLASAETSNEDKIEAMEEILILAKDKTRARIFLEEGILDSMMWTIGRYFEKVNHRETDSNWAHPEISVEEENLARVAATCCLTLGKAHCAAIHTEGDLLLMSLYEHGTVPEERQLAQMLHEIPYHTRVTTTDDPTIVDPGKEEFALKQMTLPQAEELAQSIKALSVRR